MVTIPNNLRRCVFEAPSFATPDFCARIIRRAYEVGFHEATITSEHGASVTPDIRNNDRVIFDEPDLAQTLWTKAQPWFSDPFKGRRAVRLNERFRVYRYGPGQFFDWHQDGEFRSASGLFSMFTMMIYLNEDCEGGGTSFADVFSPFVFDDFTIAPMTGKALFFHHPLSHRGDPIVSGEKYVLRTDVMFERAA